MAVTPLINNMIPTKSTPRARAYVLGGMAGSFSFLYMTLLTVIVATFHGGNTEDPLALKEPMSLKPAESLIDIGLGLKRLNRRQADGSISQEAVHSFQRVRPEDVTDLPVASDGFGYIFFTDSGVYSAVEAENGIRFTKVNDPKVLEQLVGGGVTGGVADELSTSVSSQQMRLPNETYSTEVVV